MKSHLVQNVDFQFTQSSVCQDYESVIPNLQFRSKMVGIPIFEIDPLVCPKFSSIMRTIAFIEDSDVIKKILKHQNHWNLKRKPRPTANISPIDVVATYDDLPEPSFDGYITDPNYSAEAYFKTTIEQ